MVVLFGLVVGGFDKSLVSMVLKSSFYSRSCDLLGGRKLQFLDLL
jgi:hypothetical protein